jgi:2,3-bisphosphoglycerate-independent phosphoglycerate mutase
MDRSYAFLKDHPVNQAREADGHRPANMLWLWSGGIKPGFRTYQERFGLTGGAISAVDLVRGIAFFAGLPTIDVPGITGYYDTNYVGKAEHAIRALDSGDIVFVHVEAPDEASHNGHPDEKVKAIENIDRVIVGPLHEALQAHGDHRILVLPDHYTPLSIRTHRGGAVPFAMCGTGIAPDDTTAFSEAQGAKGALQLEEGYKLIDLLVTGEDVC